MYKGLCSVENCEICSTPESNIVCSHCLKPVHEGACTPQSTWLDRFYELYEEGRKEKAPQSYIAYFKAREFLLVEIQKAEERGRGERKYEYLPRSFGKNTKLLVDFFTEGKKGKSAVFAIPEGNFLSPKAVENVKEEARLAERIALRSKFEGLDKEYTVDYTNHDVKRIFDQD